VAVMLRISRNNSSEKNVTLLLEGRILNHSIEQLKRMCEDILAHGHQLTLDLSGVSFVSRKGVSVLHDFERRRVALANCSVFVAEQFRSKAADELERER
jgi:ABC-type transporter Mla MlaB component